MSASHVPPTGDLARNPDVCPDWESNRGPFVSQASTQSTEPHQRGQDDCPLFLVLSNEKSWLLCSIVTKLQYIILKMVIIELMS